MTLEQFNHVVASGQKKAAIDSLFEIFEEMFFRAGNNPLNREQKIVHGTASFIGQVRNGGFECYMDTPWAAYLPSLEVAFARLDLPEYASIAGRLAKVSDGDTGEQWQPLEEEFWKLFYGSSPDGDTERIDDHLCKFIAAHAGTIFASA